MQQQQCRITQVWMYGEERVVYGCVASVTYDCKVHMLPALQFAWQLCHGTLVKAAHACWCCN
jgi:hypothetical protein